MAKYSKNVHSFEPNPVIFEELNKYLPNIIKNVNLYNYALSNTNGKKILRIPLRNKNISKSNYEEYYKMGLATIHEKNIFEKFDKFEINCKKLDEFYFKNKISFIKIDVEGHEIQVIDGAKNLIKKFKPNLMIEIEEKHSKNNVIESISYICSLGYQAYCLRDKELILFDNINTSTELNNYIFKSLS
tara:strand:- start:198 stop:758 length:561 start_codon:yes stop_codon:yes gene_type:complete